MALTECEETPAVDCVRWFRLGAIPHSALYPHTYGDLDHVTARMTHARTTDTVHTFSVSIATSTTSQVFTLRVHVCYPVLPRRYTCIPHFNG